MTVSTPNLKLGRQLFAIAAIASGIVTLAPHHSPYGPILLYAAGVAQIFGGAAMLLRRSAKIGAVVLGAVYLIFSLLLVPPIVAKPLVFDPWGDFFEEFTLVVGAAIVYALSSGFARKTVRRIGRILFGICVISFAVYQAVHLDYTASLVPTWVPPSQMFWSVATTVAFGLEAVALLTNRWALLATRLTTLMLVIFGLLVWLPRLLSDPSKHSNWSETVLTFGIAATSWIIADLLD
ncbi:MAG: hypothetical protein WBD74_06110 [Candidatus Aquilonibacter sp.]